MCLRPCPHACNTQSNPLANIWVTLCFLLRLHFSHAFLKFPLTRMEEVCKRPRSDGTGTSEREAQQIMGDKLGTGSAQPRAQSSLPSTVHSSAHSCIPKRPVIVPVLQASSLSPQSSPSPQTERYRKAHAVMRSGGRSPGPQHPPGCLKAWNWDRAGGRGQGGLKR